MNSKLENLLTTYNTIPQNLTILLKCLCILGDSVANRDISVWTRILQNHSANHLTLCCEQHLQDLENYSDFKYISNLYSKVPNTCCESVLDLNSHCKCSINLNSWSLELKNTARRFLNSFVITFKLL